MSRTVSSATIDIHTMAMQCSLVSSIIGKGTTFSLKLLFIDRRTGKAFLSRAESYFLPPPSRGCYSQVPTQLSSATFFIDFSREAFTRPGGENRRGPGSGGRAHRVLRLPVLKKGEILTRSFMSGEREMLSVISGQMESCEYSAFHKHASI